MVEKPGKPQTVGKTKTIEKEVLFSLSTGKPTHGQSGKWMQWRVPSYFGRGRVRLFSSALGLIKKYSQFLLL